MAQFVHDGQGIDYTPGADVAAGAVVVQNTLVGVARRPIPANTAGTLAVDGVFDFPKATGGGTAIGAGVSVYWNVAGSVANTTSAGNTLIGKSVKAAADGDATVRVRMSQ